MVPNRTCRICMDTKCESLITFDINSKWTSLFEYCFGISVVTTSQAPKVLCKMCSDKIIDYADFKKKCLTTDALWKQMLIKDNRQVQFEQPNPVSEIIEDDIYMETEYLSDSFVDYDIKPIQTTPTKTRFGNSEIDHIDTKPNKTRSKETQIDPIDTKPNETSFIDNIDSKSNKTITPVNNETEATGSTTSTRVKKQPLKYEPKIPKQKDNKIKHLIQKIKKSYKLISPGITSNELKYQPKIELKPNMYVSPGTSGTESNDKPENVIMFNQTKQKCVQKNIKHNETERYMTNEGKKVETVNRKTIRELLTKWVNDQKQNQSEVTSETGTTLTSRSSLANAKKVKVVFLDDTNDVSPPVVSKTNAKESVETDRKMAYVNEDIVEEGSDNEENLDNQQSKMLFTIPDRKTDNYTFFVEKIPKSSKFYCGICQYDSKEQVAMQQHWQLHVSKNHLSCRLCEYLGRDMADMAAHRYKHQPPGFKHTIFCTICSKLFASSTQRLEFHYRKAHLGKPGGLCSHCGKAFNRLNTWRYHEVAHVAKYKCYHCDRSFICKPYLNDHLKLVFGDPTYVCDVCGMKFHRKFNLKKHSETHIDLKLPCEHCDKTFASHRKFKHHMLVVGNAKNHVCDTCGKTFYIIKYLKEHQKRHKNTKPSRAESQTV